MRMDSLWVAEWSEDQKAFNVEPLDALLKRNGQILADGKGGGYFPIAICNTIHEANKSCEVAKKFLRKIRPEAIS
jgi:hypothetical protein